MTPAQPSPGQQHDEAVALLWRPTGEFLLWRPPPTASDAPAGWRLPGGRLQANERPEAALRRCCRDLLGTELALHAATRPATYLMGTHGVTYHCFAGAALTEPAAPEGVELRWTPPRPAPELALDTPTAWLLDRLLPG